MQQIALKQLDEATAQIHANTRVLVRVDFNVPLSHSKLGWQVTNDKRLKASLDTILWLKRRGAVVILISHLGRPKSPKDHHLSLEPIAKYLNNRLHLPVQFVPDLIGTTAKQAIRASLPGDVLLLENLRFYQEEKANDARFATQLASLADVYVNESFSACHRAHASVVGVAKHLPAFAGITLAKEVFTLQKMMIEPKRPFVVIIGGAKISDKVGMLANLTKLADLVLVGGACANTFLKADGFEIYRSRVEELDASGSFDYVKIARHLLKACQTEKILKDSYIPLPKLLYPFDVLAASSLQSNDRSQVKTINLTHNMADRSENEPWLYLDIGPKTRKLYAELISQAGTVFWNGPMGVWENPLFATGTRTVARAIVQSRAHSVLGGGDTIAAAHHFHLDRKFTYISAAGGAALEFLGGKNLPGLQPLLRQNSTQKLELEFGK